MVVVNWFSTAKLPVRHLTKLCFYYTSSSEDRKGGGTGQEALTLPSLEWYQLTCIASESCSQKNKLWHLIKTSNAEAKHWTGFLSLWLNSVEFYFTSVLGTFVIFNYLISHLCKLPSIVAGFCVSELTLSNPLLPFYKKCPLYYPEVTLKCI